MLEAARSPKRRSRIAERPPITPPRAACSLTSYEAIANHLIAEA
jgi:hypothetical protein